MSENRDLWENHFPQFFESGDPGMKRLMNAAKKVDIPAGQQVFYPGGACENYLLMLDGNVKAQLISENGREIMLYHVLPGDSCVLTTSCLLSGEPYPAEAVTEQNSTAFVISGKVFHQSLNESVFFRQFVFNNFALRLSKIINRIEQVIFEPVENRLSKLLLAYNKKQIEKTHQELAAELGTAREVVSRHLKNFEGQGWIMLRRGTIEIIDPPALMKIGH
jgi:CRP/FNR family transcriptional regulator